MDFSVSFGDICTIPPQVKSGFSSNCLISDSNGPGKFYVKLTGNDVEKDREKLEFIFKNEYLPLLQITNDTPMRSRYFVTFMKIFAEELNGCENGNLKEILEDFRTNYGDYAVLYDKSKNVFYRVNIINYEAKKAFVYLIDEGLFLKVPLTLLFPMCEELIEIPYLALPCYLNDVYPSEFEFDNLILEWPSECNDKFNQIVSNSQEWVLTVGSHRPHYHPGLVPVFLHTEKINVIEELIATGLVKFIDPEIPEINSIEDVEGPISLEECLHSFDPMTGDFKSSRNQYDVDIDDPAEAIFGYAGSDDSRICEVYAKKRSCPKGKACPKEHVDYTIDGWTSDVKEILPNVNLPDLPTDHDFHLKCIEVVSDKIYIVLRKEFEMYKKQIIEMEEKLVDPNFTKKLKKLHVPPSCGEVVLVYYNDLWYRGKCLDSNFYAETFEILLVDFGFHISASKEELRAMEEHLLEIPFLVRSCQLWQIRPLPNFFNELNNLLAAESYLKIVVRYSMDNTLSVDLIGKEIGDCGQALIKSGHAEFVKMFLPDCYFTPN